MVAAPAGQRHLGTRRWRLRRRSAVHRPAGRSARCAARHEHSPAARAGAGVPGDPVVPDPQDPLPVSAPRRTRPCWRCRSSDLPPVVPGIGGAGGGVPRAGAGVGTAARPPATSRVTPAERPAAPRGTDTAAMPASYRAGYGEYLRTAGMPQVIAVAVPGATGIMLLTGAGGLIGYRQARAGRAIRASSSGRFTS